MIPLIIGAGMALAGTALNAVNSANTSRKMRLYFDKKEKEAKNDYNNALGDASQSAAVQQANTQADKAYQEGIQSLNNAVNDDPVKRAQALDSINTARAGAASNAAVMGEQMRRDAKAQYNQRMDNIDAMRMNQTQQDAANANAAYSTLTQVGGQIMGAEMSNALNGAGQAGTAGTTGAGTVQSTGIDFATAQKMQSFKQNTVKPLVKDMGQNIINKSFKPLYLLR